jgi:hypothetical protein
VSVKLRGPAGGVIEVSDDIAERYLGHGYSKVEADKAPARKAEPVKPRAKARKGD